MTSIQNELQTISIAETSKLSEECNENSVQQKKDFCNNEIENSQNCCYRHPKHKSSCTTNIGNKLKLIIKNMNFRLHCISFLIRSHVRFLNQLKFRFVIKVHHCCCNRKPLKYKCIVWLWILKRLTLNFDGTKSSSTPSFFPFSFLNCSKLSF